ncbi:MAG: MBL fold metallo-hydrolase [Oscillospiraceae bacterium]|nr:MBL fold metallo-hydrolase [Oscillospiraceae bacterium]
MKLSFFGAAREVTGSCHYLEACGRKIFIDCGLPQGVDVELPLRFPVPAGEVDFVLLTHAHIDHAGRLPLLKKLGFKGKIYATPATCDLASIMLRDSAHIQESDAEWQNRKARRSGRPEVEPLYTTPDALAVIADLIPCDYEQIVTLAPGLTARFRDIGHLLGSACIEVWAEESGETKKIVFSGDIGNAGQPLLRDPVFIQDADYVVMEATYGDRDHTIPPDYAAELAAVIQRTFDRGGNVVIPAFAVGRTQEMLYFLRQVKERNLVTGHDDFLVYVDSPLANEATTVFLRHQRDCYDQEAQDLLRRGINPIGFSGLKLSLTGADSKAINDVKRPLVIISASGMCDAGRIRHHLKHNLWRKESTIAFTGYQAHGTVGRALLEGAGELRLFGETVYVKAEIVRLSGISGHAGRNQLLEWVKAFSPTPKRVFIVHGETAVCDAFAAHLQAEYGIPTAVPEYSGVWDLAANRETDAGVPLRPSAKKPVRGKTRAPAYIRLLAIQQRLSSLIGDASGWANRDLNKLTDQIASLCAKWER